MLVGSQTTRSGCIHDGAAIAAGRAILLDEHIARKNIWVPVD